MNLEELMMKMLQPDKWREQQAMKLSSGLGSLPYSFQEQMQIRAPRVLDMHKRHDAISLKNEKAMEELGPEMPAWFPERYWVNEAKHKRDKENLYKLDRSPGI